jgi:hypothetical protein
VRSSSRQKTQVPSDQAKRRDDEVAGPDGPHVEADGLDDADEFVAHPAAGLGALHLVVRPEVAAADARAGDAQERVGGFDEPGVPNALDADVARAVHDCRFHADH